MQKKIAFNDSQKYLINNGFHYNYDKEKDSNYKFYSISLTNGSTDKPINLTGGFSISISTDKSFSKKSKSSTVSKISISELLNDGYTKEEIISFINQTDFTKQHPELTEEENDYLKNFALDILDIRYNLYLEHKDDKIEVIEINKEPFEEDIDGQTKSLVKKNNHNKK